MSINKILDSKTLCHSNGNHEKFYHCNNHHPNPIYLGTYVGNEIVYPAFLKGATGATGPAGGGEVIAGYTVTVDSGKDAKVTTTHMGDKTYLNFFIPKGDNGNSEKIKVGFVETAQPYENANVADRILDGVHYLDFVIPRGERGEQGEKGDKGATGPMGVVEPEGGMIISYVDPLTYKSHGEEILSNGRLPLKRLELDNGGVVSLNEKDNTIKFLKTGVYKFTFMINGYVQKSGVDFSHDTDFVAVALRGVGSDNIYGALNGWTDGEVAQNMFGQGMLTVADTDIDYELVNLQKKSMFLVGANITQTISNSYFSVPMVSLVITKV